jgi:microcystin-dependent protein
MATPYLAEIRLVSFGFPPRGWALCDGQLLPINQNQALFSLLGTTYGGDGRVNFGLPNLQGRVPVHMGDGLVLGQSAGEESVTLSIAQLPAHVHLVNASPNAATVNSPTNNVLAQSPGNVYVNAAGSLTSLLPSTLTNVGGAQPHENRQPYLTLNFCIALTGIFPTQN